MNEAHERVAALFTEAGWTAGTKDGWDGRFVWRDGVVVGGVDPWGIPRATAILANREGPNTLEETAAWLIEHAKERAPAQLTTPATLDIPLAPSPEAEETLGHEGDGETGEEAEGGAEAGVLRGGADGVGGEPVGLGERGPTARGDDPNEPPEGRSDPVRVFPERVGDDNGRDDDDLHEAIDADFTDDSHISSVRDQLEAEALPDFTAEMYEAEAEASGSQFIFGDNLYQMRTAAIGLAMQAALARMPAWSDADTARLSELRNFAMGVSEGRWNDDTAIRAELDTLEATLRLRSRVVAHRDALVEFLNAASREEVEGFDPEAGWPA